MGILHHIRNLDVCMLYLLPGRGDRSHEFFDILRQQILHFQNKGELVISGDFNARISTMNDSPGNTGSLPPEKDWIQLLIHTADNSLIFLETLIW